MKIQYWTCPACEGKIHACTRFGKVVSCECCPEKCNKRGANIGVGDWEMPMYFCMNHGGRTYLHEGEGENKKNKKKVSLPPVPVKRKMVKMEKPETEVNVDEKEEKKRMSLALLKVTGPKEIRLAISTPARSGDFVDLTGKFDEEVPGRIFRNVSFKTEQAMEIVMERAKKNKK